MEGTEVKVDLVIDNAAKETAKEVEQSLENMAKAHKKVETSGANAAEVAKGMSDAVSSMVKKIATAIGIYEILHKTVDKIHEAFNEAVQAQEEYKRGTFALMALTGAGLIETRNVAIGIHEQMENFAIEAGVSAKEMTKAFADIAEYSDKPIAAVEELTKDLAMASQVVPGGLARLSEGMQQLEKGMVNARNPIVQLIASTNTLQGSAKEVAKQLQKMPIEEQMKKAEAAIKKTAEEGKKMPASFSDMAGQFKDMAGQWMKAAGDPMMASLMSVLGPVRDYLIAHKEEIAEVFAEVGERIGQFAQFASDLFTSVTKVFGAEIAEGSEGLKSAMEYIGGIWDEFRSNTDAIAKAIKDVFGVAKEIYSYLKPLIENMMSVMTAVPKFINAVPALFGGRTITSQLGFDGTKSPVPPHVERFLASTNKSFKDLTKHQSDLDKMVNTFREMAKASGMGSEAIEDYIAGMKKLRQDAVGTASKFTQAFDQTKDVAKHEIAFGQTKSGVDMPTLVVDESDAQVQMAKFIETWQAAQEAGDEAALNYGATILEANKRLQKELLESGAIADGAITDLSRRIKDSILKLPVLEQEKKALDSKRAKGPVNDFRGSTFNIKQDFRDQDPDRVAVIFRRDILESAQRKGASRLAGAFGS